MSDWKCPDCGRVEIGYLAQLQTARKKCEFLERIWANLRDDCNALRTENAKLRAALEDAPVPLNGPMPSGGTGGPHGVMVGARDFQYSHWFHTTRAEALK
jgi:hypothetical protein